MDLNVLKILREKASGAQKDKKSGCLCCGKCCELFGGHLHASRADIERWQKIGREDLLNRINRLGWIWVDPETKRREKRCPFLRRTGPETACCTIHEVKPDMCRAYPTLAHGRRCLRGGFLKFVVFLGVTLLESLDVFVNPLCLA